LTERERQVRRASQTRRRQIVTDAFLQRWRDARARLGIGSTGSSETGTREREREQARALLELDDSTETDPRLQSEG
jgi:hypothetical protein